MASLKDVPPERSEGKLLVEWVNIWSRTSTVLFLVVNRTEVPHPVRRALGGPAPAQDVKWFPSTTVVKPNSSYGPLLGAHASTLLRLGLSARETSLRRTGRSVPGPLAGPRSTERGTGRGPLICKERSRGREELNRRGRSVGFLLISLRFVS